MYLGTHKTDSTAARIIDRSEEGGEMELKGETYTIKMTYRKVR
jgi:hypothetical protein